MRITNDYYEDSEVTLYNGDIRELLKQIPNGEVMLVVTSPPYNIGKEYEQVIDINDYLEQQKDIIKECYRVLNEKGSICWQVGNYIDKKNGEVYPLDILLYPLFKK